MPTFILRHQLHNQTQISADSILAQPFATQHECKLGKMAKQMKDVDGSENKQRFEG